MSALETPDGAIQGPFAAVAVLEGETLIVSSYQLTQSASVDDTVVGVAAQKSIDDTGIFTGIIKGRTNAAVSGHQRNQDNFFVVIGGNCIYFSFYFCKFVIH